MKTRKRFLALVCLGTLSQACRADLEPAGPKSIAADAVAEDQPEWGPWSTPINLGPLVNSPFDDNRPAISKDGLSLYFASDRPGGSGGLDIWVSHRPSVADPWGAPQNLGPTVNSSLNDVAPTFSPDGHRMYFHSFRAGGCGLADIYVSRRHDTRDDFGWGPPEDLGCVVNTRYVNAGPTIFEDESTGITTLYFTVRNNPPGSDQGFDIYASTRIGDEGAFGPPVLVPELSSPFRDTRTAIRRDGLEIFLSSGRPGGVGSEDLWVSTRASTLDPWSTPVNLGAVVNTTAFDGGPALSFDGTTLYFHSNRPGGFGGNDLYVTTRTRLREPDVAENAGVEKRGRGKTHTREETHRKE
jgi:hypothetical protein